MSAAAVDEDRLRELIPGVLAALVPRGADLFTAEGAVQAGGLRGRIVLLPS